MTCHQIKGYMLVCNLIDNFPITVLIEYKVERSNEWIKASVKLYQGGELRITLQE